MRQLRSLSCLALAPALAAGALAAEADLSVSYAVSDGTTTIHARLAGAAGDRFVLSASATPDASGELLLGVGDLVDGRGTLEVAGPELRTPAVYYFRARYFDGNARVATDWNPLGFSIPCERLNFNWQRQDPFGSRMLETGEVVSEQWAEAGIHVSAESSVNGTDTVVIFDSSNPTGGDFDLQTPGYGPGNDTPLGNLLIIASDVVDLDDDDMIDDPDDDENGGTIYFDFDDPVTMCSIGVVDMDDGGIGSVIRFRDGDGTLLDTIAFPSIGDNSFQEVFFTIHDVQRVEVFLKSSGAIPFMGLVPCPSILDFDSNTFGVPLAMPAGTIVTEFAPPLGIGTVVEVENNSGGPDEALVFDTSNPTGGDFDLQTPGFGPGNDTPEGNVLIVAENVVDQDNDELVDNPDDEAAGGMIALDFPAPVLVESVKVLDIDQDENAVVMLFDADGAMVGTFGLAALGDNSAQTIEPNVAGVSRLELHLSSSGALAEVVVCPPSPLP